MNPFMNKRKSFLLALSAGALLCLSAPAYAAPLRSVPQDVLDAAAEDAAFLSLSDTIVAEEPDEIEVTEEAAAADTDLSGETPAEAASAGTDSGSRAAQLVAFASQYIGNPYRYGGASLTGGADCSGFLMAVYAQFGIALPHSSAAMRGVGGAVGDLSQALPGDILVYSGHVGIYLGNGQMLSALNRRAGITVTDARYKRIRAIRRVL